MAKYVSVLDFIYNTPLLTEEERTHFLGIRETLESRYQFNALDVIEHILSSKDIEYELSNDEDNIRMEVL